MPLIPVEHRHRRRPGKVHGLAGGVVKLALALSASASVHAQDDPLTATKATCIGCHGPDGNGIAPQFPKLAGQHADYLAKQLRDYMTGRRTNEIMTPLAALLKPQDVPALAAQFAGSTVSAGPAPDPALAAQGKRIYEQGNPETGVPGCIGCHHGGADGSPRYPRIAGQYPDYLAQQMKAFQSGSRTNDRGRLMRAIAARMTPQEIDSVSAYLGALR